MLAPFPTDKLCYLLEYKAETTFLLLSLQKYSKNWIKKVFNKFITAQVHG